MKIIQLSALVAASAIIGLASCSDSTSVVPALVSDAVLTNDIAISAGDEIASSVDAMILNETSTPSLPGVASNNNAISDNAVSVNRTRTCYNAAGAVVTNCSPIASVRKIVTHVQFDGTRSGSNSTTGGTTRSWSGAVHRTSNDTLVRNFNTAQPPVEQSRTHTDLTVGNDTTTFSEGEISRLATEATSDSIKAVTWNLPRSSNPFPVSGSIVRNVTVHVTATRGTETFSREVTRRVEIVFPPDAQGNVVLTINDKTCNLNLVTHVVSNCH